MSTSPDFIDRVAPPMLERLFIAVQPLMSEEDRTQLGTLITTGTAEEVIGFLEEKVPNFAKRLPELLMD